MFTRNQNECSRSARTGVHNEPEWVFILGRNMHKGAKKGDFTRGLTQKDWNFPVLQQTIGLVSGTDGHDDQLEFLQKALSRGPELVAKLQQHQERLARHCTPSAPMGQI